MVLFVTLCLIVVCVALLVACVCIGCLIVPPLAWLCLFCVVVFVCVLGVWLYRVVACLLFCVHVCVGFVVCDSCVIVCVVIVFVGLSLLVLFVCFRC